MVTETGHSRGQQNVALRKPVLSNSGNKLFVQCRGARGKVSQSQWLKEDFSGVESLKSRNRHEGLSFYFTLLYSSSSVWGCVTQHRLLWRHCSRGLLWFPMDVALAWMLLKDWRMQGVQGWLRLPLSPVSHSAPADALPLPLLPSKAVLSSREAEGNVLGVLKISCVWF